MLPPVCDRQFEASTENFRIESKRVLEPVERISEVLFGLIIVLTFTGTVRPAQAGDVRAILIQALGCTLAWAIIDASFYLIARLSDCGRKLVQLRQLRGETDPEEARRIIAENMPPVVAAHLRMEAFELLHQELKQLEPPSRPRLSKRDWKGALAIFLLASAALLPVSIPFVFMSDAKLALLISHGIAIVLLFLAGWALGRHTSEHPLRVGITMVAFGSVLIAVALLLGG